MKINKLTVGKWIIVKIFLLQILIIFGFWYGNVYKQIFVSLPSLLISFGRLAGLLLVFFTLIQLILRGRIPPLESYIGFERLNYLHKKNGYLVFVLLLLHPLLLVIGYAISSKKHLTAQYLEFFTTYEYVWLASLANFIFIAVVVTSIYAVRKRLKYEIWFYIHVFTYLAVVLAFFHQLAVGTDFLLNQWFKTYWYFLYLLIFAGVIYYRFIYVLLLFRKHKFYVDKVVKETSDTYSIYIKGKNINEFKLLAGQFLFIRFLLKEFGRESHPFSFSVAPNNDYLRVSIKNSGDFTSRIREIKQGTKVIIDGPHGAFTEKFKTKAKIIYIAGGVGITPIRSMIESLNGKIEQILFYASQNSNEIIFKKELDELSANNPALNIYHVISRDESYKGIKGRINLALISNYVKNIKDYDYYICGPVSMAKSIITELSSAGISSSQIHFEEFAL